MDRRRWIQFILVGLTVLAVGDFYVRGFDVFEDLANAFSIRLEVESLRERLPSAQRIFEWEASADGAGWLEVHNASGRVTINGHDRDTVAVRAVITAYAEDQQAADSYAERAEVNVETEQGRLRTELRPTDKESVALVDVEWQIDLPRHFGTQVVNEQGEVDVANLDGTVIISNDFGGTGVTNVRSNVSITTGAGNVEVSEIEGDVTVVSRQARSVVTDVNGSVRIEGGIGLTEVKRITGEVHVDVPTGSVHIADIGGQLTLRQRLGMADLAGTTAGVDAQLGSGLIQFQPAAPGPTRITVDTGSVQAVIRPDAQDYRVVIGHSGGTDIESNVPFTVHGEGRDRVAEVVLGSGTHMLDIRVPAGEVDLRVE